MIARWGGSTLAEVVEGLNGGGGGVERSIVCKSFGHLLVVSIFFGHLAVVGKIAIDDKQIYIYSL